MMLNERAGRRLQQRSRTGAAGHGDALETCSASRIDKALAGGDHGDVRKRGVAVCRVSGEHVLERLEAAQGKQDVSR
jgi:hypothetical protein